MANMYFCVFETAAEVALGDPLQESAFSFTGTSAQSAAITGTGGKRRRVRVWADSDCYVTWGANPTALTTGAGGRPLAAKNAEYFDIEAGHKIAAIVRS